jgi:two-component system, chemotaxis family, sensor kinase CheA
MVPSPAAVGDFAARRTDLREFVTQTGAVHLEGADQEGNAPVGGLADLNGGSDDQFLEMFYEEARELLLSLEVGLTDLERGGSDPAHIIRTYRAAHTLKGAAAMVGLESVAEFTRGIEAVLDRIRASTLAIDSEVTKTLLEARDQLAAMVEAEAAKARIAASGELTQRLLRLKNRPLPPA